jgi:hypothetical protein
VTSKLFNVPNRFELSQSFVVDFMYIVITKPALKTEGDDKHHIYVIIVQIGTVAQQRHDLIFSCTVIKKIF